MSESGKKFDFNEIINNIKSMISPDSNVPSPNPDDAIGMKVAELSLLAQELANAHSEQAKTLTKFNKLLNAVFKDIEALRASAKSDSASANKQTNAAEAAQQSKEDSKTDE